MAGVSVQSNELVQHQDRAMLSDAVSPTEIRLSRTDASFQAFHQINPQSVILYGDGQILNFNSDLIDCKSLRQVLLGDVLPI